MDSKPDCAGEESTARSGPWVECAYAVSCMIRLSKEVSFQGALARDNSFAKETHYKPVWGFLFCFF